MGSYLAYAKKLREGVGLYARESAAYNTVLVQKEPNPHAACIGTSMYVYQVE